jgi:hypothetical protein
MHPDPLDARFTSSCHCPAIGLMLESPSRSLSTGAPASISAASAMSPATPEKQSKYATRSRIISLERAK